MSDLIPAPRSRAQTAPDPARLFETLATLVIVVASVGILYVAREILVPLAIAILLSFVLSPLVKLLRAIGIGKGLAVGIIVLSAFLISVGLGFVLAKQVSDLAAEAPNYQETVSHKVEGARAFIANNPLLKKMNAALSDVARMTPPAQGEKAVGPGASQSARTSLQRAATRPSASGEPPPVVGTDGHPVLVSVVEPPPGLLDILRKVAGIAASPVATAAFVAIFIVFILMQREDLRNRFIRLMGSGDLQRTTLAMNDAARRLSRYFLAQMLLNTGFGVVVAVALTIIGVPSAILWGIISILMRFIPYVGSVGSAFFPVVLAAAASPGWGMAIETLLLFVVIETIVGQVLEPLIYGHNTGISPIAVVLSATFWTWLWGPVGLVLSTPLTVCLVVIGRHVERLAFLDIILGDAPALTPVESFYQRILANDVSEISDHAERFLKDHTLTEYCDEVALQALLLAQTDVRRGRLDGDRLVSIKKTIDELAEDLFDREADTPEPQFETRPKSEDGEPIAALDQETDGAERVRSEAPQPVIDPAWQKDRSILCIAGRTPLDEAAAELLAYLLRKRGFGVHIEPATSLTSNDFGQLGGAEARLVILSFLDADLSIAQARFAVRRLRRRIPNVPIVGAFWTEQNDKARSLGLCSDARSDLCVATLGEAVALCLEHGTASAVPLAA